jgi:hypothetical protein
MQPETKQCQNCKNDFTIESEDFAFYEKIDVPAPTFCWECRMQRRMSWRNERNFHRRTCAATNKPILSAFSEDSGVTVYERDYWWSDDWDAKNYGRDYDFSRPFFEQFQELLKSVPLPNLFNERSANSPYTNHCGESKDCYMLFACWENENVMYTEKALRNKDSLDIHVARENEQTYQLIGSDNNYNSAFLFNSNSCTDSYFLYDCKGCQNCFMSANLRNASYVFRGEQLTKEEYKQKMDEIDMGSFRVVEELKKEFVITKQNAVHKYANLVNSHNCTGDNLRNSKNSFYCFDNSDLEDCSYNTNGFDMKDTFDTYGAGICERMYEVMDSGDQTNNFIGTVFCWNGHNVYYSYACHGSDNIFGCIGIQKGKYFILNKQYSKEEYEEMLPKIKKHMNDMPYIDSKGREYRYGEFFPSEISPFGYNETIAGEYYPKTKQEALDQGLNWRDKNKNEYPVTMKTEDIPDNIADVNDDIVDQIIECTDKDTIYSPGAFKITHQELQFYRKMNLPLPRKSPDVRYYDRLTQRNPLNLWKRTTEDGEEVMTPFAPDRPEKIYSEKGYQDLIL